MEDLIKTVFSFAGKAHGQQRRKYTDELYIEHLWRVMELTKAYTTDLPVLAAALLHDVLEDTKVSRAELLEFLNTIMAQLDAERTLNLVVELTDVYVKSAYPEKNRRQRKDLERKRIAVTSRDAQTIKYADIVDNCKGMAAVGDDFTPRFLAECKSLLKVTNKGNEQLKLIAVTTIENELNQLRN